MAKMLNAKQAQELVHTIEKALDALPKEVLSATVCIGTQNSWRKVAFGRSLAHLWTVNTNDASLLRREAENGRLEVTC